MEQLRIAAVVLAAGQSRRMGRFKPLLPLRGKPVLARVIENVLSAGGIGPLVIVTGHDVDRVSPIILNYPVRAVHNAAYASGGMLSSIQTGLATLKGEADAVFIVLGDQPMVRPQTLAATAAAWRCANPRPRIVLPTHAGKHGHPILLSADGIDEVLSLSTDQTLKAYTDRHVERTLELDIEDPAVLLDLDTPADYAAAIQWLRDPNKTISVRSTPCPSRPPGPSRSPAASAG